MQLPDEQNPVWKELIYGESQDQFDFLATKIILGRLSLRYRQNPSPQMIERCVQELRRFFDKNSHLPKVQADLKKIFGEGGI
jgi:hypothetical protein